MTREASCSCGQLRVTVEGEPVRVSVCHCLACQRRTGSAFGYQARFPIEVFEIEGDYKEHVRYSDEGEERRSSFCPECGSTVFWKPRAGVRRDCGRRVRRSVVSAAEGRGLRVAAARVGADARGHQLRRRLASSTAHVGARGPDTRGGTLST